MRREWTDGVYLSCGARSGKSPKGVDESEWTSGVYSICAGPFSGKSPKGVDASGTDTRRASTAVTRSSRWCSGGGPGGRAPIPVQNGGGGGGSSRGSVGGGGGQCHVVQAGRAR